MRRAVAALAPIGVSVSIFVVAAAFGIVEAAFFTLGGALAVLAVMAVVFWGDE
jgi:hypothetical protein